MKSSNGEVKFSFLDILLSPFTSIWNMAKSKDDIGDEIELNPNSDNKIEAVLADSQKEIDKKVEAHGGQSKTQRSEMLKQTKVDAKTLKDNASKKAPVEKEQVETKQASKDEGHEIGE